MFFDLLPGAGYVGGHRGNRSLAPENTLIAAQKGLAAGADFWEMDVQRSADGRLIVFHDDDLGRTTDVTDRPEFASRKPWLTSQFSLHELQRLNAGSWFIRQDPFGTIAGNEVLPQEIAQFHTQKIPTLDEVLAFTSKNSLPINIEIKDQIHAPGDLSIVSEILDVISAAKVKELVLISSFNHEYLQEMRRLSPDIPLAALVEGKHPENLTEYLKKLGVKGYNPDAEITDEAMIRDLTAQGYHVSLFTVNDMEQAISFIDAGCYSVITDFPHTLRQRLGNRDR